MSLSHRIAAALALLSPEVVFIFLSNLLLDRSRDACQPQRINPLDWVRYILVQVEATGQTNRICRNEPPHRRIVIPMPVVMQPRLRIMHLPLERLRAV